MKETIKWHIEALRIGVTIVSVVVAIVLYGARLDKQIALNQQMIDAIMNNHLEHVQSSIDSNALKIDEMLQAVYEVKALVRQTH